MLWLFIRIISELSYLSITTTHVLRIFIGEFREGTFDIYVREVREVYENKQDQKFAK